MLLKYSNNYLIEFFSGSQRKRKPRQDSTYLLFFARILCSSLLFVDDPFSVRFQERLCISFSRCSLLETRLFTYVLYCSLSRSSRRILPILVSFLTFLCDFLDSLYAVYLVLSLDHLSLYIQPIFNKNPLSTNLNYKHFLRLTKLKLFRYCCLTSCLEIAPY